MNFRYHLLFVFASLTVLYGQNDPNNPLIEEGQITRFNIRQGVFAGSQNDWIEASDSHRSHQFSIDRTGVIRIETEISHTYSGAVDTSLVDADGVLIDSKEDTNNPSYIIIPARYTSPFFIRVHNASGSPALTIPITTGRSGHKDGSDFQREIPNESMDDSSEYEEKGDSDEGEYGEESSYGGCGVCKSCDLSHSKEIDDVTTDHPNGIDGTGVGDGAAIGQIPAGTSANGDSKTNINFDIDFGSGVNLGDFKLHSLGDATVTRNSSLELTSITTDSSYTSLETIAGGSIRIRHSYDPSNPTTTVFREITFENTAPREIKKTSVLYPGASNSKTLVTIWRHNPSAKTWECVIANGMRKKKLTLETDTPELKVERHQIFERAAGATGEANVLISDVRKTYVKNQHGWKKTKLEILGSPGNVPLITTWTYYDTSESSYAATLLKSVTRHTGEVKNHQYFQSGSIHRHEISGPFAETEASNIETRDITLGANSREITEKDGTSGMIISKRKKEWTSFNSVTNTTTFSSSGSSITKSSSLNTFGDDLGGKVISAYSISDMGGGSLIRTGVSQQILRSSGDKTVTQYSGQMNSSNVVIDGQKLEKIINEDGVVLRSMTTVIQPTGGSSANGAISADSLYSNFDTIGRPRRVDYFPTGGPGTGVYHELRTYGCCGADTRTDRYGITSYIEYDDLGRAIKTNRLSVTQATVYDGLSVHSHRYPGTVTGTSWSGAPAAGNLLGTTTTNLQGTVTTQTYRSPQTGDLVTTPNTTTRYFLNPAGTSTLPGGTPADVGMRTVQVLTPVADDDSVPASQTTDYFRDGKVKETFGNLSPRRLHQYERNATGLKVTQSYSDGTNLFESVITQYDYAGRTLTVQQGSGTTTYHYTQDKLTRVTDPDGVDVFYLYNARGEQDTTVLDLNGNNAVDLSTDQVTRTISQPMMATPPGSTTAIAVNGSISQVIESGTTYVTTGESYSTFDGLLSWSLSPGTTAPSVSQTTLSGSGNWTETTTAPDNTQQVQTYTAGKLTSSSSLLTDHSTLLTSTSYAYDSLNRLTTTTDSRTGAAITEYYSDTVDAVKSVTDAATNITEFTYDHRGRRTHVDQPNTDGHDNITITKYQPNGKTKEVTGDQTYRSTYTYDYAYRMKTLTTYGTETATTTWNYDATRGWLINKRDAADKGATYTYTDGGRLRTRTWARGKHTRYDYDAAGRLKATRYFLDSTDDEDTNPGNDPLTGDVTYVYNRLGQNLRAVSAASSDGNRPGIEVASQYSPTVFRTESNGIVIDPDLTSTTANGSTSSSLERTIHRKYDPTLGRGTGYLLTQGSLITSTLEAETTYRYSATNGRFAAITSNPVGAGYTTTHDFIYGYENNSNLLKTTQSFTNYNFSTNSGTAIHQVTRNYEGNRNVLASIINKNSSTNLDIYATAYSVNEIGQRDAVTRSGSGTATPASASAAYTYNERGELATANEATDTLDRAYEYDGIGNREKSANSLILPGSKNYTVNALNQYTAVNLGTSVSPAYDDDGNATAYPLPVNPAANSTLTYDGENRLIKVVTMIDSIENTIEYTYDSLSRRIIKTVGTQRTYYVYDGWNCISEYTGTKHTSGSAPTLTRTQSYTWGLDLSQSLQGVGGVGGLLAVTQIPVSTAPETYYPLYDGNGNITAYIDETCDVEASFDYDPFGNITNNNNPLNFTYAFSTKPLESETGLYYYGYRWYDSVTGRWINRDPIEEEGGLNLYGFVNNSTCNNFDVIGLLKLEQEGWPSGMDPLEAQEIKGLIKKCSITIFISHYIDVVNENILKPIFEDLSNEERIKELDLKSENPCARVAFLTCWSEGAHSKAMKYLKATKMHELNSVVMRLPVKNEMCTNSGDRNPDTPGKNAKSMIEESRKNAEKIAKEIMCNCSCKCDTITVRTQLYGGHWIKNDVNFDPNMAGYLRNFLDVRWAPYFTDKTIECKK